MTLNVAQYLAPLNSQQVLTGYTQGVKDGSGLTIAADGTISLDKVEAAVLGFLVSSGAPAPVLNWSTVAGTASSVLLNDGAGNVEWSADYVPTFPVGQAFPHTGAALLPTGTTAQRPAPATTGLFRFNTTLNYAEYHNGAAWLPVTQDTGAVFSIVSATEPVAHAPGDFWYDTSSQDLKVWTGTVWISATNTANSYIQIDSISSFFDGVSTVFPIRVGGIPYTPVPSTNFMLFLGGVPQTPGATESYQVFGNDIVFSTPPAVGTSFYATTIG